MNRDHCIVHKVDASNLKDQVESDDLLCSRLQSGWSVVAPIAMEESGRTYIALIMAPPAKKTWRSIATMTLGVLMATALVAIAIGVLQ